MLKGLPKLRFDQYLSLVVISLGLVLMPVIPRLPEVRATLPPSLTQVMLIEPAEIPVLKQVVDPVEFLKTLSAQSIVVTDEDSGSILLEKNAQELVFPASTTKLMTALVAREVYYLSQVLEVTKDSQTVGNVIDLVPGEKISVNNLLRGLLVSSGNDTAMVLARNHPQGYEGFIRNMNEKAQQLGLTETNFSNPAGLDESSHQMTARDLSILMREVIKDDQLKTILSLKEATVADALGEVTHFLYNTNRLLEDPFIKAGKTGTTEQAKQVLATVVERDNKSLIIVVMGSEDRYSDTHSIIDWIFENYEWFEA